MMQKRILFLYLLLLPTLLFCEDFSRAMQTKLSTRGEKIANIYCDKEKLQLITLNKDKEKITKSIKNACPDLDKDELLSLEIYISRQNATHPREKTLGTIPKDAKCPTCGMIVSLYPKWAAEMKFGDRSIFFDGVKDMMRYYLQRADFVYERKNITQMRVQDFYTLEPLDATKAFYVIGSNVRGPMGNEFIPFYSYKGAKTFLQDHHARSIIKFEDITPKMIKNMQKVHLK